VELVCAIKSQLALLEVLDKQRGELDGRIRELARTDPLALNLMAMPGVGPHTALMLVARVAEPSRFKDGRAFVSWLGLAPGESSSGTRRTQTGVTCRGDRALRAALVRGATSVLRHARAGTQRPASRDPWLDGLIKRRGDMAPKQMAVALAGRMARQLRAMMVTGECWLDATGRSELRTRRNLAWQATRAAGKAGTGTAAVIAGSIPEQEATAAAPA
jgi:transposase